MAREKYCRYSSIGRCSADDYDLKHYPYLKLIDQIVKLTLEIENIKIEEKNEQRKRSGR